MNNETNSFAVKSHLGDNIKRFVLPQDSTFNDLIDLVSYYLFAVFSVFGYCSSYLCYDEKIFLGLKL